MVVFELTVSSTYETYWIALSIIDGVMRQTKMPTFAMLLAPPFANLTYTGHAIVLHMG